MRRADLTDEAFAAATSPWRERGARAKAGCIAHFKSSVLDAFTRTPPWLPYVLVTPFVALLVWRGLVNVGFEFVTTALLLSLGALSWTLVEYLMHRFLFHAAAASETGKIITFLAHGHHHVHPDDRQRIAATPLQLGSLTLLFWGAFEVTLGRGAPLALAGVLIAYLAYEFVHFQTHHGRARSKLMKALRRHHLAHHHKNPHARWGIGTPLWDVIFRTMGPRLSSDGSDDGEAEMRGAPSDP